MRNIEAIRHLCAKHKVRRLFVFGSVLTDAFNAESDVDMLVEFEGVELYEYADNYFNLKASLEALFNREVDLLELQAIKNPYFKETIDLSKELVYG